MKLQGEHLFPVRRQQLWEALLDPTLLARVLPGAEPLESTGENRWKTALSIAVGPVQGRFQGNLAIADLVPPESYRLVLDGSGPAGFLRGGGTIRLLPEGEGERVSTRLFYEMDAQVGGRLAAVGQRLVESSARAMARQGLEGLERELAARDARKAAIAAATGSDISPPPLPAPPSTARFAARFARGLWSELPASWRWTMLAAVALLAVAVFVLIRD